MKRTLIAITFSIVSNSIIYAKDVYVAPQAIKVMFHVDKLPIDQGMRKQLAMNLTILAKRAHDGSAWEHRLTAQLLMLAMRLDRENTSAVELNGNLSKGGVLPVSDVKTKVKALQKLRDNINLLSKTDKLSEARVLESYLQDVLIALDNSSPLAAADEATKKRWSGIVSAAEKKPKRHPDPIVKRPDRSVKDVEPTPPKLAPKDKRPEFTKWTRQSTGIATPLIFFKMEDERARYSDQMATINTLISPRVKMESQLSLELKPWADAEQIEVFQSKIDPLLKAQFGKYESLKLEITTSGRLSEKSRSRILLPLCLQLKASQKNIQMRKGICVLGRLSGNNITRESDFWHLLKFLRKSDSENYRLLIPLNAEADLRQLIALEEEDFFVRNEVLMVSNIEECTDLLGQSETPAINEASADFAKIQQMIGVKSVGPFAANKNIRAKLEKIIAKNPNHLSAKMILLRGNVSRSKKLDTYFIADELSVLLGRTSYMNKRAEEDISGRHSGKLAKEIEAKLEELEPFLNANDRKVLTHIIEIKDCLETIERAKAKQHEDMIEEKRESKAAKRTITEALASFKIKYLEAKTQLDQIMSQPPKT